jgi:hypothetical protein
MVLYRGKYLVASRYEVFFDYCGKQQAQSMVTTFLGFWSSSVLHVSWIQNSNFVLFVVNVLIKGGD